MYGGSIPSSGAIWKGTILKVADIYFNITSKPAYDVVTGNSTIEYLEWLEKTLEDFYANGTEPPTSKLSTIPESTLTALTENYKKQLGNIPADEYPPCPVCGGEVNYSETELCGFPELSCSCGWTAWV